MPPEILTIINQFGLPGVVIVGMWFVLRQVEKRNAEKDVLIYAILKEGQTRVESLVTMVLELNREDAKTRAELKAAVETQIEVISQMKEFCRGQQRQNG